MPTSVGVACWDWLYPKRTPLTNGDLEERGHDEPKVHALETEPDDPIEGGAPSLQGKHPERGHPALDLNPGFQFEGGAPSLHGKHPERGHLALDLNPGFQFEGGTPPFQLPNQPWAKRSINAASRLVRRRRKPMATATKASPKVMPLQ